MTLNWNVVPWWSTKNPNFPGRTVTKEAPRAAPYLVEFIRLLVEPPRVLVLSGDAAQKAWDRIERRIDRDLLSKMEILRCPHPSPISYNAGSRLDGRKNKVHIYETFRDAVEIAS